MHERLTRPHTGHNHSGPVFHSQPTVPMISLTDAMQIDFDYGQLDLETDLNLHRLQARAEESIAGWHRLEREMVACEIAWYNSLHKLVESIKKTLTTRYGCND